MKKTGKKLFAIILAICTLASLSMLTPVGAVVTTTEEVVGAEQNTSNFQYEISEGYAKITGYTGESGPDVVLNIPSKIDGHMVKFIKFAALKDQDFLTVRIPNTVTFIARYAFGNVRYAYLGSNVDTVDDCAFKSVDYIYVNKKLRFTTGSIKINKAMYYGGSPEDYSKSYIHWYNINNSDKLDFQFFYNCSPDMILGPSKVVSDDFELTLTAKNENVDIGEITLEPGTYELKVHKADGFGVNNGSIINGYNKTVNDSTTGGLTTNSKYQKPVKLVATGGTYRFIFYNKTNVFMIQHISD